jgi:hypothetical protein
MLFITTISKTRCIVKRRTAFEYKLQKRIVQEADFLRYIQVSLKSIVLFLQSALTSLGKQTYLYSVA